MVGHPAYSNLKPGPCEHCGSPDRSKQCRFYWWRPYSSDWRKSGADLPCGMDDYNDALVDEDRRLRRRILLWLFVALLALLISFG